MERKIIVVAINFMNYLGNFKETIWYLVVRPFGYTEEVLLQTSDFIL
jgi:hypothetical protein